MQALVFLPWAVPTFLPGLNWAWLFNPVVGPLPHWLFALGLMTTPEQHPLRSATRASGGRSSPMSGGASRSSRSRCWPRCSPSRATSTRRRRSTAPAAASASASITLPFLAPTIAITVLLRTVWIANFADLIVVMTSGGPADRTQIVASYIFTQAFQRARLRLRLGDRDVLLVLLLAYSFVLIVLRQLLIRRAEMRG